MQIEVIYLFEYQRTSLTNLFLNLLFRDILFISRVNVKKNKILNMSFLARSLLQVSRVAQPQLRYATTAMATEMKFTFASASEVFYNQSTTVKQVDVNTLSGSVGILVNHVPILAALKPGVVVVTDGDSVQKFFVSSGSVAVNPDSSVQLLAEEAFKLEGLDVRAAEEQLTEGKNLLASAKDETERAEAQIQIDTAEAIIRAVNTGL